MKKANVTERIDPRDLRRRLGLNQQQFWGAIGVTQSGGSRYESGRSIPKPVQELLRIVHGEGILLKELKNEDWLVVRFLKAEDPKLYNSLKNLAKSFNNKAKEAA